MKRQGLTSILALWVSIFLCMHRPAMADVTGTILVTVTDPSGAAVPGVKVTLNTAYGSHPNHYDGHQGQL